MNIKWKSEAQKKQEAEQAALAERFTWKTDIWTRCTESEAEQLDGALQEASVKQRRMWDDCVTIEHTSALFTLLNQQLTDAFGSARAAELLAPSNGA